MILSANWPEDMEYLTPENYTGSNTPERSIDLRSFFVKTSVAASYGKFALANDNVPFNGNSTMKFDMDILSVSIQSSMKYNEKPIGSWTAGFKSPLRIESIDSLKHLKVTKTYRVAVVEVSINSNI